MIYEDEKFEGYGTDSLLDRNVTKLSDVISDAEDVVKYVYDFGDYWRHSVEIEATQDTETKMVLPELRLSKFSGLRLTPMNCEILFKLFQLCFPLFSEININRESGHVPDEKINSSTSIKRKTIFFCYFRQDIQ
jgi:hypothetical protein